jgi:glycerol-3-phosphate acyltransferase PlsX
MGGDKAPEAVIQAAHRIRRERGDVKSAFFGREEVIAPILHRYRALEPVSEIIHTDHVVAMEEKPSIALRQGKRSSMRLALDAVAQKKACAMISAGNTGALMVMAKFALKTLPGIHRPAITATIPARNRKVVMLDMGANIDCTSDYLVQFAMMGDAYARAVLGVQEPQIGLLNVGSEEMKGHDEVKEAHKILRSGSIPVSYYGFVEGNDITEGTTDVVVTDGFTGNIALKTAEGASRLIYTALRTAIESSLVTKLGYLLLRPSFRKALGQYDPRKLNGAILLGLNGIAVKSHGSADGKSFATAIRLAIQLVEQQINQKIMDELSHVRPLAPVQVIEATPDVATQAL